MKIYCEHFENNDEISTCTMNNSFYFLRGCEVILKTSWFWEITARLKIYKAAMNIVLHRFLSVSILALLKCGNGNSINFSKTFFFICRKEKTTRGKIKQTKTIITQYQTQQVNWQIQEQIIFPSHMKMSFLSHSPCEQDEEKEIIRNIYLSNIQLLLLWTSLLTRFMNKTLDFTAHPHLPFLLLKMKKWSIAFFVSSCFFFRLLEVCAGRMEAATPRMANCFTPPSFYFNIWLNILFLN